MLQVKVEQICSEGGGSWRGIQPRNINVSPFVKALRDGKLPQKNSEQLIPSNNQSPTTEIAILQAVEEQIRRTPIIESWTVSISPADLGYRSEQKFETLAYQVEKIENGGMLEAMDTIISTFFPVIEDPSDFFARPEHLMFIKKASKMKKQEETLETVTQKAATKRRLPLCCASVEKSKSPQKPIRILSHNPLTDESALRTSMLTEIKLGFFAIAWFDKYELSDQDTFQKIVMALLTLSNDHLRHFRQRLNKEQNSQKSLDSIINELQKKHKSTSA